MSVRLPIIQLICSFRLDVGPSWRIDKKNLFLILFEKEGVKEFLFDLSWLYRFALEPFIKYFVSCPFTIKKN